MSRSSMGYLLYYLAVFLAFFLVRHPVLLVGVLLIFAGLMNLTGAGSRFRVGPRWGWLAGLSSGLFGGMVGNQGGIRSAALLSFGLTRDALAVKLDKQTGKAHIYAEETFRLVTEVDLVAPAHLPETRDPGSHGQAAVQAKLPFV